MSAPLADLLQRLPDAKVQGEPAGVTVHAVTFDHREVIPGALHCCLPGATTDGRRFAGAARRAGAVAFLCEQPLEGDDVDGAVEILVPEGSARHAMALVACAFEGDPAAAMTVVGVTGTNGKTTVTFLLQSILVAAGRSAEVVGTLSGARTTPEAPHLQRRLAELRDSGCSTVAREVTSHALAQHRVDGFGFDLAVFTNLTQDHLDFHGDMESYFRTKMSLFAADRAARAVVNSDDPYGRRLLSEIHVPAVVYGMGDATDLQVGPAESRFHWRGEEVRLPLGGSFNVSNALAAAAVAAELGVAPDTVARGLAAAKPVPGRFEAITNDAGISVLVDYAHTPDGLEAVLRAARDAALGDGAAGGRLIVVFGCGGDRDHGKRPVMGHLATTLADMAVLTSDNPRSEDPLAIVEEVRRGCDGPATLVVEPDRAAAVTAAILAAAPGDVVVLAGKGHETTQELAGRTVHLDDRELARDALAARAASFEQAAP